MRYPEEIAEGAWREMFERTEAQLEEIRSFDKGVYEFPDDIEDRTVASKAAELLNKLHLPNTHWSVYEIYHSYLDVSVYHLWMGFPWRWEEGVGRVYPFQWLYNILKATEAWREVEFRL